MMDLFYWVNEMYLYVRDYCCDVPYSKHVPAKPVSLPRVSFAATFREATSKLATVCHCSLPLLQGSHVLMSYCRVIKKKDVFWNRLLRMNVFVRVEGKA